MSFVPVDSFVPVAGEPGSALFHDARRADIGLDIVDGCLAAPNSRARSEREVGLAATPRLPSSDSISEDSSPQI